MIFCSIQGKSQTVVSGQVIGGDDQYPVLGASVVEVGTTNGTLTDIDGKYTITVSDTATLRFSYLGYITQDIKVIGMDLTIQI